MEEKFECFYQSSESLMEDFIPWMVRKRNITNEQAKLYAGSFMKVWDAVECTHTMAPRLPLGKANIVEDKYFEPKINEIRYYNSTKRTKRPAEASTIRSRVKAFNLFLDLITSIFIYVGILASDVVSLRGRFEEIKKSALSS